MNKAFLLIALAICFSIAYAQSHFSEDQLEQKAVAFIEAKNAWQQPDSDIEDIERFLALLADEFIDEHIKFGVTVTDKTELRNGMAQKLEDEVFYSRIQIDQMMIGNNVVFVKYTEGARVKPQHMDEIVEYSSTNTVSLEFDESGLITRIRRHHG